MMFNTNNAIKELDDRIAELQSQKALLKNLTIDFNSSLPNQWHEICETPMREESKDLIEIAKVMFPWAEEYENHANYMKLTWHRISVYIPTSRIRTIEIDFNYYMKKPEYNKWHDENWCEEYVGLLENKASWEKLARYRCNRHYKKWVLFLWWFLIIVPKDKKLHRDKEYFKQKLDTLKCRHEESFKLEVAKYNEYTKKWAEFFTEIWPKLEEWGNGTEKIVAYNSSWMTKDLHALKDELTNHQ